jgi:hypothetical protein
MSVPKRKPFCDECITPRLAFVRHQEVRQATTSVGSNGRRHMGTCVGTGRLKLVIHYGVERPVAS